MGYPLTILGGIMGKNLTRPFEAPVRTKQIPREIPQLAFYKSPFFTAVVGVLRTCSHSIAYRIALVVIVLLDEEILIQIYLLNFRHD